MHLISTSTLASFAEDGVDIAIRSGRGGWAGMAEHRLMPMNLTPVCAPSLRRGRQPLRSPADLMHHTILHSDQWPQAWRAWLAAVSAPGVDPAGGRHFQDTPMAVDAALAGMGVAIVPRRFVQAELAEGKLVAPFGREIRSGMAYYLLYPQGRAEEPRVVRFRDWLLAEFASERPKRKSAARASGDPGA